MKSNEQSILVQDCPEDIDDIEELEEKLSSDNSDGLFIDNSASAITQRTAPQTIDMPINWTGITLLGNDRQKS